MAQADQTIQNAQFAAVRSDINDNLAALFSQSSGPSAPAVTTAFQPWIDTSSSPPVWKMRNAANNDWITVGVLDGNTFKLGGITAIANGGTGATTAAAALTALLPNQSGQAGKGLTTDGTSASWGTIAAGASVQVFASSGTYTPTAGKTTFLAIATGGGGGGGSLSPRGGGGGGGTALRLYSSSEMGASAVVTIGAGGGVATNGGNTSFNPAGTGLTITGAGGATTASATPGAGGTSTNSLFSIDGQSSEVGRDSWLVTGGVSFWAGGPGEGGATQAAGTAGIVMVLEW